MDTFHLLLTAAAAGAIGCAVGFWRECAQAREQVNYLRRQIAHLSGGPVPNDPNVPNEPKPARLAFTGSNARREELTR